MIEERGENNFEILLAGDASRNQLGFQDKFNKIVSSLEDKPDADRA